jgi:hypothetical protein
MPDGVRWLASSEAPSKADKLAATVTATAHTIRKQRATDERKAMARGYFISQQLKSAARLPAEPNLAPGAKGYWAPAARNPQTRSR